MTIRLRLSRVLALLLLLAAATLSNGCRHTTEVDNTPGASATYDDPETPGRPVGLGLESQDVIAVGNAMARDIMATGTILNRATPPRLIVDDRHLRNDSSAIIDKKLFTDIIRVRVQRAAQGRLIVVGRQNIGAVERERELAREGITDGGTLPPTKATAGSDFRLVGTIRSLTAIKREDGAKSQFYQITFELLDLETGEVAWSNNYELRKAAQYDAVYR